MSDIIDKDLEHLESVLSHISRVRANCELLGKKLIKNGDPNIGLALISHGLIHDYSKIQNEIEWKFLRPEFHGTKEFELALKSHHSSNPHHPEYWPGGIHDMSPVFLAEFVCDVYARSQEFATDLRDWIIEEATKKYDFTVNSKIYKSYIKVYLDLLLNQPFKATKKEKNDS